MFIVSLVSHISFSPNGKCKCVQSIYTWRKMQNKRLWYRGPCCRGWLLLSALLCVVLIRRSVVHTKMPNIFIVPPPFKETDGRTAWSQEESGDEACTQTPGCSFCYLHSISSIFFFFLWDKPVRGNFQRQHVLEACSRHLVWDRSCPPPTRAARCEVHTLPLTTLKYL